MRLSIALFTTVFLGHFQYCYCGNWTAQKWDMIIVGAGPAGIIVADRMAAAGRSTLLIEGGGASYGITGGDVDSRRPPWLDGTNLTRVDVPGLYKSIFDSTTNSSLLTCGPVANAYGGCCVGGSSAINAGLFFEPPASDWDLYHPAGWKSIDMKASIQRLYARQPSSDVTSRDKTRYLQSGYDASRKWLVEILHFEDVDINAKPDNKTRVFGHPVFDYSNGQRGGPVVSYLGQAQQRTNFHLQSNTRVLRVEREGSKVTGVKVLANNVETLVLLSLNGRVVLSGGAIQSPGILMFSGIGPPDELSALQSAGKLSVKRSDWINSTAVGSGLFDNPNTFIELEGGSIQSYAYSYDRPSQSDRKLYLQERSGPYSFASETSVFWDTLTHPDGSVVAFQGTTDSAGYGNFTSNKTMTLNIYGTSGLKSSGKVVLDKEFVPGPSDDVYYSDPQDAKDISNFIYKVFQGLPNAGLTPKNIPQNSTQQQIQAYITTPSAYAKGLVNHWSSSCRIGKCVDANTTVIGMENLHVVDGSIIAPLTVNPQFGIMAAAERASELILALDGAKIVSA